MRRPVWSACSEVVTHIEWEVFNWVYKTIGLKQKNYQKQMKKDELKINRMNVPAQYM